MVTCMRFQMSNVVDLVEIYSLYKMQSISKTTISFMEEKHQVRLQVLNKNIYVFLVEFLSRNTWLID